MWGGGKRGMGKGEDGREGANVMDLGFLGARNYMFRRRIRSCRLVLRS